MVVEICALPSVLPVVMKVPTVPGWKNYCFCSDEKNAQGREDQWKFGPMDERAPQVTQKDFKNEIII